MNDARVNNEERGKETSKQEVEMTRRELLKKASPLGRVSMINRSCTACGLCVAECDAGALSIYYTETKVTCRLLFRHYLCIACGRCVKICPEQCLKVERTLNPSSFNRRAEVLFEGEVVTCSKCGTPFTSRAMVDNIKAKLGIAGEVDGLYLEFCPGCKDGIPLNEAER